jgi:hypothetical protein
MTMIDDDLFKIFKGDFSAMAVYSLFKHSGNGIYTSRDLCADAGIGFRKLRSMLGKLESLGLISCTVRKNKGFHIVLQEAGAVRMQHSDVVLQHSVVKKQHSDVVEKPPKKAKALSYTPEDLEIARDWLVYSIREMSWSKPPKSWTEENFAHELSKIRKNTNLNHTGLRAVLNFVEKDHFWAANSWSPAGLLKKSSPDKLRKIDYILQRMKPASHRQQQLVDDWKPLTDEEKANPFLIKD